MAASSSRLFKLCAGLIVLHFNRRSQRLIVEVRLKPTAENCTLRTENRSFDSNASIEICFSKSHKLCERFLRTAGLHLELSIIFRVFKPYRPQLENLRAHSACELATSRRPSKKYIGSDQMRGISQGRYRRGYRWKVFIDALAMHVGGFSRARVESAGISDMIESILY
jgi:hypothetical protein